MCHFVSLIMVVMESFQHVKIVSHGDGDREWMDRWMDGQMGIWTDRWIDRRTDGWTDADDDNTPSARRVKG